jgi:2-aminoethylphosphonate-pyruvate transaminase
MNGNAIPDDDLLLLTPGPLTTSKSVRRALLRDWGSRDGDFLALTDRVRAALVDVSGLPPTYAAVPLPGCGTFALEATIESLIGPDDFAVVLENGAYGKRLGDICQRLGKRHRVLGVDERERLPVQRLADMLSSQQHVTRVLAVHCETSSGLLNQFGELLDVIGGTQCRLILDAMSTFGAIPLPVHSSLLAAVSSANKCLEGVPGVAFALVERDVLQTKTHEARSLTMDLPAQHRSFEATGEWRFTPPTHVVAALGQALLEHAQEGGIVARGLRYRSNYDVLMRGMGRLGVKAFLPRDMHSPIIVSFEPPSIGAFDFATFYAAARARGFVLYPGKLTHALTFRVGCIGRVSSMDMARAVIAIEQSLSLGERRRDRVEVVGNSVKH